MPARSFFLAAALAPSLAAALPWDGTYRLSEDSDCDKVGEEGGSLLIAEGVLQGVESSCRMTEPVDVLDLDATLYVLDCEGEGQSWTERAMLMKAAEGDAIFIAWRGYVFRYDRCPAPEDASAAEKAEASGDEASDPQGEADAEQPEDAPGEDAPEAEPSEDE